jgi:long-chain acyl-CoA synthetase
LKAACREEKVKKAVLRDFERAGKKKLTGFEKVKGVLLAVDPFTVENETLTPTLKLKRPVAAKKFRTELDVLYKEELERPKVAKAKL